MADVLIKSETMASIADAIREKLGVSNTYFPSEMPDAIKSIEGGGGETPAITDITFAEDYSALATTVDGDIREITPTMVDGVITEIDVDGAKIAVEYDEDGVLTKVGSVDIDMGGLVGDWYTIYSQVPGRDVSITIDQYEHYKKFAFISGWNTINPPFTEYPEGWTDISKSELESGTLNIRNADGNSGYYVTNNSGVLSISPYCISYAPSKSSVAVGIIGWK